MTSAIRSGARAAILVTIAVASIPAASAPEIGRPDPTISHKAQEPGAVVRVEHRDPTALPSRGPANALVTIELFFTPGMGSRASGYALIERLQANHPSRIHLIYRIVQGNGSARLHYAALEAHAQGKFFEFMDALHAFLEKALRPPTDRDLLEMCRKIGMDPQRLALVISKPPEAYTRLLEANDRRRRRKLHSGPLPNALFNGQLPKAPPSGVNLAFLETEYETARGDTFDQIDRGVDPRSLLEIADQPTAPSQTELMSQAGQIDEELDDFVPGTPPLAKPPLGVQGLPSYGPATAEVTILVLCSPTSANCRSPLANARIVQEMYPTSVRVVWAPYFSIALDNAADLTLLGDAALCAEQVGTASDRDEFTEGASPGWLWIERMRDESANRHHRVPVEQLIERVALKLKVDHAAFGRCRAELAGTTVTWIEAAHRSGVRTTPASVVGGRIYPPLTDANTLQQLVETELGPGALGSLPWSWRTAR